MSQITLDCLGWIQYNLTHGVEPDVVIQELININFEPQLAQQAVMMASLMQGERTGFSITPDFQESGASVVVPAAQDAQQATAMLLAPLESQAEVKTEKIAEEKIDVKPATVKPPVTRTESVFEERKPCTGIGKPWTVALEIDEPNIVVYDHFLTEQECDRLIQMSRNKLQPSHVVDNETGKDVLQTVRKSQGTYFRANDDALIEQINQRCAEIMKLPRANGEDLQILNYQIGGEYLPHYDYFPPDLPGSQTHFKTGGQRVATLIMYLNDVEEGGQTVFPELKVKISPKKGSALFFSYFHLGLVDPMTLHGGMPVIQGEKWIATKWVRENEWRQY